jgi:hypothetical protein
MKRPERGQASVAAALSVFLLVLLAAGIVDLVRLWEYRAWGYRAAEAAALAGTAAGRDFDSYVATGEITLDAAVAGTTAEQALLKILAERGLNTTAIYDIRVQASGPGTYPGYPPCPHAGMTPGDWSPDKPAVGVYLEFAVQPVMYGWVNGNATIPIHVFAAAGVVEAN